MGKGKKAQDAPEAAKSGKKAGKKSGKKGDALRSHEPVAKLPKKKCCESKSKCGRCPLRMLKEGTLPEGYTVHKRKLVKVADVPSRRRSDAA